MFFIRQDLGKGEADYIPVRDDNVYLICDWCGGKIQLEDPMADFAEFCSAGYGFDSDLYCDKCQQKIDMILAGLNAAKQAKQQNSTVTDETTVEATV